MLAAASKDWQTFQNLKSASTPQDLEVISMSDDSILERAYGGVSPVGETIFEQHFDEFVELGLLPDE